MSLTVLEIKHQMRDLPARDLNELQTYLTKLRHSTPEWKQRIAEKIRAGRFVTIEEAEKRVASA